MGEKLGALKNVARNTSTPFRKRLADGCIMSRLIYGISIWGLSINKTPLKKVQRVQNVTMCWVLGLPWWTKTTDLLEKLNWLSIYQLAWYHSLLLIWKVYNIKGPTHNFKHLTIRRHNEGRLKLTRRRWSIRAGAIYQTLPDQIKGAVKLSAAKSLLKEWVKTNIPFEEAEEE